METVATTQTRLETFIKEYCAQPSVNLSVDLSPGSVLSELLIKLASQLHNQLKNDAEIPSAVASIKSALAATTDTYSEAIDAVASNYNVVRDSGQTVTGTIKVVVAVARTYYVGTGFQFIQPNVGGVYTTNRTYRVEQTLTDNPSAGELKLYAEGPAGPYYFLLPVTAEGTGTNVAAQHNTALALNATNTKLDGFVEARAFGNFNAGRPVETDRELISRFQTGLSTKGLMSPKSIESLLPDAFPGIFTHGSTNAGVLSVVGASDEELRRGKNTTFGITQFGLADIYVRSAEAIETGYFAVTATCYNVSPIEWEITLTSAISGFPNWFYELLAISYTDDTGVVRTGVPTSITFTAETNTPNRLAGSGDAADENDVARFTKYQRAVCRCSLPGISSNISVGSAREVQVLVSYMPFIGDIQDYMLRSDHRIVAADYLVKAVIPCRVTMNLGLHRASSNSIDTAKLQQDIYNYINNLSFGESIVVSRIIDICHNYDVSHVDLPVTLQGSLLLPKADLTVPDFTSAAGAVITSVATDTLSIPTNDETLLPYGVSAKTAMFFVNFEDTNGQSNISIIES